MYLFTLMYTSSEGHEREFSELAVEMAQLAEAASGVQVVAYQRVFPAPVGAATLYGNVDSFAALGQAFGAIRADRGYQELAERLGRVCKGSAESHFLEIPAGPGPELLALLTVDSGLAKLARMNDAIAFAMEMASIISNDAKQHTVFALDMYGPLGAAAWITPAKDYAELDSQGAAIMGDEQYKKLMSESPALFDALKFNRFLEQRIS
ncbi:MAG: hypothetical protein ACRD0Z_06910 [Acidimicrobiales bacterium]